MGRGEQENQDIIYVCAVISGFQEYKGLLWLELRKFWKHLVIYLSPGLI